MSLTKKDPSMRVAANDPHLVSLGGGRLSTAVTIHNIPVGDTTIGSSSNCSISLNGSGVQSIHCTIYRSEENEVTLVPERDARILIDGMPISQEANLIQGAMITIGNSYYLRYNNPAEAQMIRSVMGSNERISMPQIDFTQVPKQNATTIRQADLDAFYEANINPAFTKDDSLNGYDNVPPVDINGLQCPKVFTADLITVNMPAKDVLGQKYANFAKNFAENHRSDKSAGNILRNNQLYSSQSSQNSGSYVNIPDKAFVNNSHARSNATSSAANAAELLTKVHNVTPTLRHVATNGNNQNHQHVTAFDCYPKPGAYGGLQIFSMNGVNTEINNATPPEQTKTQNKEHEVHLEDMIKICTEYADRQNSSCSNSITSSPIVQNRIKTNGSLPREKKSPFANTQTQIQSNQPNAANVKGHAVSSSGYENVRLIAQNRVEINGQLVSAAVATANTGYENVVIGKYVPQSPRTKIRTTCLSPKKEHTFNNVFATTPTSPIPSNCKPTKQSEYEQLIKNFEEKLQREMHAIEESSRYKPTDTMSAEQTPVKRNNRNINNLKLNLQKPVSAQSSPKLSKKPAPAPRTFSKADLAKRPPILKSKNQTVTFADTSHMDVEQLKNARKDLLKLMQSLKNEITELQKQEDEVLRELDLEEALVSAELNSVEDSVGTFRKQLHALQNKIHRLEAQRNATRVMEENQQAKLKQSIEMKLDQVHKLSDLLKRKPNNECLKEELHNVSESLENDRKTFEDLEFQYLEEESEWHAYREELSTEEKELSFRVEEKRMELQQLETHELNSQTVGSSDAKTIKNKLNGLHNKLQECQQRVKTVEANICDITGQLRLSSSSDEDEHAEKLSPQPLAVMSQSLFGSAELLCPKRSSEDIMSKSVNENMFYNSKIELPATSTPKRPLLRAVNIEGTTETSSSSDPLLRLKYNIAAHEDVGQNERVKLNLSLGSDDFEVNPLEKRVPSQDDIDRICKIATDAPISTKGASTKIFDSIKEIERNRQLLLAQQGHHVIEHERQKMHDLKKKSHDEARAQYLSMLNNSTSGNNTKMQQQLPAQELQTLNEQSNNQSPDVISKQNYNFERNNVENVENNDGIEQMPNLQRLSQPEFESQHRIQHRQLPHLHTRPLSDANSELSCDLLSHHKQNSASKADLSTTNSPRTSTSANHYLQTQNNNSGDEAANKRSSVNSNETASAGTGSGSGVNSASGDRKRMALPKHQRPLTRYLPIFSPDLNLRHHIESAGHQIALCPHVFVDAYSCRGYLHKLGATFHGWARRWFVLDRQRNAFIYYADKAERKPRGGAYFSTIDEVYLDHLNASKSGRPHCTFVVKTKKRSYHLQAASDAAARIWIDAIITGAQGNLDY